MYMFWPARQSSPWGAREAVFSSSEDRARASQATLPKAGASFVFHKPRTCASHAAASLFAVIFPSDCRICGLPLSNISRLPLCEQCLDSTGATVSECAQVLLGAGGSRVWVATVARTPKMASQYSQIGLSADQEWPDAGEVASALKGLDGRATLRRSEGTGLRDRES